MKDIKQVGVEWWKALSSDVGNKRSQCSSEADTMTWIQNFFFHISKSNIYTQWIQCACVYFYQLELGWHW